MPPGFPLAPYIAADLQSAHSQRAAGAGSRLARMQGPSPWYEVNRDTLARSAAKAASWPARRRIRRQNEYIFVRSVLSDPADSVRAQQVAATGPQIPHAYIGRAVGLQSSAVRAPA